MIELIAMAIVVLVSVVVGYAMGLAAGNKNDT